MSASKIGGLPSYVELITRLEMARDVERMRATSPETTGAAAQPIHTARDIGSSSLGAWESRSPPRLERA